MLSCSSQDLTTSSKRNSKCRSRVSSRLEPYRKGGAYWWKLSRRRIVGLEIGGFRILSFKPLEALHFLSYSVEGVYWVFLKTF
jgi:hypothetical protein